MYTSSPGTNTTLTGIVPLTPLGEGIGGGRVGAEHDKASIRARYSILVRGHVRGWSSTQHVASLSIKPMCCLTHNVTRVTPMDAAHVTPTDVAHVTPMDVAHVTPMDVTHITPMDVTLMGRLD